VDSNVGVAPDGTLTADMLREDSTASNNHFVSAATATGLSVGSTQFTVSVFVKAAGRSRFRMYDNNQNTSGDSTFDLSTGTVVSGSGTIESCGNGWYRCSITPTCDGSALSTVYIELHDSTGSVYTGNSYSGIMLWGYQLETGQTFASSYITSNSGSETTRAADSASLVSSSLFDNGGASIVMETENVGRAYYAAVLEDDSTGLYQDYVALTVRADNKARQTVTAPGSTVASDEFSAASTVGGSYFKIASRFAPNDFGVCIDGGAVTTDTSGAVPSNVDKLFIGWYDDGGRANAHIKRVAIYPPLSDTNLQALTS
jgi:hypothetical protein